MAEVSAEEVAAALDRAHDELLVRGWTQGLIECESGSICSLGALVYALGATPRQWHRGAETAEQSVIVHRAASALGFRLPELIRWNDDPARELDDVLDAFRHAAKKVREAAS